MYSLKTYAGAYWSSIYAKFQLNSIYGSYRIGYRQIIWSHQKYWHIKWKRRKSYEMSLLISLIYIYILGVLYVSSMKSDLKYMLPTNVQCILKYQLKQLSYLFSALSWKVNTVHIRIHIIVNTGYYVLWLYVYLNNILYTCIYILYMSLLRSTAPASTVSHHFHTSFKV